MDTPVLAGIIVYPVKGCRGILYDRAVLWGSGLLWDREWMIVDRDGTFVSQRTVPKLARIETVVDLNALVLRAVGHDELALPLAWFGGPSRAVTVHRDCLHATDCGDRAAAWMSAVLAGEYRIVRMGPSSVRPVASRSVSHARTAFADAFPLLAIGESSLEDLNRRIIARGSSPVRMDRFRPNLVVGGCVPYAEDAWRRFRIGEIEFVGERPCTRCSVTTVDQQTGERGVEPLATLATYRRTPDGVIFGMNVTHRGPGERDARGTTMGSREIAVGMPVEILEQEQGKSRPQGSALVHSISFATRSPASGRSRPSPSPRPSVGCG